MRRNWVIRSIVAFSLSTALVVTLLSFGDSSVLVVQLGAVSPSNLLVWSGLYLLLLMCRAVRFKQVYAQVGWLTLFRAVSVQGGLNRIMPFRLGELSLPYLIRQRESQHAGAVLFALGWIRLLEFALVCAGMVAGLSLWSTAMTALVVPILLLLAIGMTFFFVVAEPSMYAESLSRWMACHQTLFDRIGARGGKIWASAALSISRLPPMTRMARVRLLLSSIAVYVLTLSLYDSILDSFGVTVSLSALLIGVGASQLSSVLPILTIGSVGLHEAGWVSGFVYTGMSADQAISSGVLSQCITLILGALYAILTYFAVPKRPTIRSL